MTDLTQRTDIPSPCYVLEEARLIKNLELMKRVQDESGARIILALKGFSMWSCFDIIKQYLHGATASSVWEYQYVKIWTIKTLVFAHLT